MNHGSAAEREAVRKLARGSLLSRLKHNRQPLKLVAVPRDHVQGDRQRGEALLAGRFTAGTESIAFADLDLAASGPLAEQLEGFSWLRDLSAAASRESPCTQQSTKTVRYDSGKESISWSIVANCSRRSISNSTTSFV